MSAKKRITALSGHGLTESEAETWLMNEPHFDRPIIRRDLTGRLNHQRFDSILELSDLSESGLASDISGLHRLYAPFDIDHFSEQFASLPQMPQVDI